ncbi:MAG: nicotinate (nicotinamide) nucleotide adenylyltransferase, partial [Bryobacteraceae bacterium]|nr:nicotinate (nicotinamide) nucleotide adenylyltransferase [Bryobacteraceae bacterium]
MRIAFFGGTFDPFHNAHLAMCRLARDRFALDRVLLVPANLPPHKQDQVTESWQHRFEMVRIGCQAVPGLEPSDLEQEPRTSYSILTIERLKSVFGPDCRLFFLIGADAFAEIQTWHRWADVIKAVEFIVVTRPGHEYGTPSGARVWPLEGLDMQVSSSDIRDKLAACE